MKSFLTGFAGEQEVLTADYSGEPMGSPDTLDSLWEATGRVSVGRSAALCQTRSPFGSGFPDEPGAGGGIEMSAQFFRLEICVRQRTDQPCRAVESS